MKELSHRSRKILAAVISEYLSSGDAVGSRKVTRRQGIDLSPATVRNVMADLEEMGLLEQPHTSSGRVPTDRGLRFFIDSLLKVKTLTGQEQQEIRDKFAPESDDFDAVLQHTSKMLSDITQYAGLVLVRERSVQKLTQIEFVPLTDRRFLCILVTEGGHIENKLFRVDFDVARDHLGSIHRYLNDRLRGHTLAEVRRKVIEDLGVEKNRYDSLAASALALSRAALAGNHDETPDLFVSGKANLLDSHATDDNSLEQMRELLRTLEEKETIVQLLDKTMVSERVQVFLGAETANSALGSSSIVAVPYGPDEKALGALAVIGPTRMNYGKVMSVVDFTADLIGQWAADS